MNNIGIVILTKNNFEILKQCIDSIIKTVNESYTLYVCDTGSSSNVIDSICTYLTDNLTSDTCKFIQVPQYHFAGNYNLIINEYVIENIVLMCNDDIILHDGCVDKMYAYIDSNRNIGTVGCKLLFDDGTIQHAGQHVYVDKYDMLQCTHHGYRSRDVYISRTVAGNTAACCMIRKQVFLDNNGFDETYTECWEDVQFNMRLILAGYQNWFVHDATATHLESITRTKNQAAKYRLRYDYTYKLKPWFDALQPHHKQQILNA